MSSFPRKGGGTYEDSSSGDRRCVVGVDVTSDNVPGGVAGGEVDCGTGDYRSGGDGRGHDRSYAITGAVIFLLLAGCAAPVIPEPRVYTGADFAWVRYYPTDERSEWECQQTTVNSLCDV